MMSVRLGEGRNECKKFRAGFVRVAILNITNSNKTAALTPAMRRGNNTSLSPVALRLTRSAGVAFCLRPATREQYTTNSSGSSASVNDARALNRGRMRIEAIIPSPCSVTHDARCAFGPNGLAFPHRLPVGGHARWPVPAQSMVKYAGAHRDEAEGYVKGATRTRWLSRHSGIAHAAYPYSRQKAKHPANPREYNHKPLVVSGEWWDRYTSVV